MVEALHHAGLSVEELGCINAHGTGTDVNDRTESKAVARLVGERPVPVYSFKSQVGHCLGAAGILEASAGLLAMRSGIVPATINFSEPRPGCSLDYVPNVPRKVKYKSFVSCNYAFGGNNAGAVIGLYEPGRSSKSRLCEKPRTVITGCGAVSSLGLGIAAHLEALISGKRGLRSIGERVGEETKAKLAGCVPPYSNRDVDRRLDFRSMKPISRFATAAARFALEAGGIRLGPREGKQTGIINGVYVGPSEESHLLHSIPSRGARADISSFTQVVANATAGWVSNALMLKGYTTTISQGADAGLFALLIAHYAVSHGSTPRLLAGAADELYTQYFKNYDSLDLLHTGEHEQNYKIALELDDRRVLGEGAAFVLAEEREHALKRKAKILAELVGYASTTSVESFKDNNHNSTMLSKTVGQALQMAGWQPGDVGLVLWTPKGNSADMGTLEGLRLALGPAADRVPLVTSVFHTGLCEATSGTITLAAVLAAWSEGTPLWKQITGVREIDERRLPAMPVRTLTVTASDLGFNLVLAHEPGERLG
jgi:3-oxoacyl-(acyl-carrier-protein) synthase